MSFRIDTPTPQQRARWLIAGAKLMTIATADEDGQPWVSPVFYAHDDEHNLYWVSHKGALHSTLVRRRAEIAIVIHDTAYGAIDAVYIAATAVELSGEVAVRHGMTVMATRPQSEKWKINDISEVTGDGPWRIYKAIRTNTETRVEKMKGGKTVVEREAADF